MKFVYFGYDFAINTLKRLIEDGHELVGIFTFPCDNVFTFNNQIHQIAQKNNIPISQEKANQATINHWINRGCELFLAAGYPYKIPHIDENEAYGINVHPSLLPAGRGIMPLPHIIMSAPEVAGFTAHKITDIIDDGDILAQMPLPLYAHETIETLSCRIAMAMPGMIADLTNNLPDRWGRAKPQASDKASTFPAPDDTMRTIEWTDTIDKITTLHRAFGRFGLLFKLNNTIWVAYHLNGWREDHSHPPGTQCLLTAREIVIAAQDGYICITEAEQLKTAQQKS